MPNSKSKAAQQLLARHGFYTGPLDGDFGPASYAALVKMSERLSKPPIPDVATGANIELDKHSYERFTRLHPELQRLLVTARKQIPFAILDSTRGRAAQERAFALGNSKAHFGDSAHNYEPAIAVDLAPIPLDWNSLQPFKDIQKVIGYLDPKSGKGAGLAKSMKIPLRWGGDWNMDGSTSDGWDFPHYELTPWRQWAKQSKLYQG